MNKQVWIVRTRWAVIAPPRDVIMLPSRPQFRSFRHEGTEAEAVLAAWADCQREQRRLDSDHAAGVGECWTHEPIGVVRVEVAEPISQESFRELSMQD